MTEMIEPSSLWTEASDEVENRDHAQRVAYAHAAVEPVWPFLAAANTQAEYETRKMLAADTLRSRLTQTLGETLALHYTATALEGLDARFAEHLEARAAEKVSQGLQQAAAARVAAALAHPAHRKQEAKTANLDKHAASAYGYGDKDYCRVTNLPSNYCDCFDYESRGRAIPAHYRVPHPSEPGHAEAVENFVRIDRPWMSEDDDHTASKTAAKTFDAHCPDCGNDFETSGTGPGEGPSKCTRCGSEVELKRKTSAKEAFGESGDLRDQIRQGDSPDYKAPAPPKRKPPHAPGAAPAGSKTFPTVPEGQEKPAWFGEGTHNWPKAPKPRGHAVPLPEHPRTSAKTFESALADFESYLGDALSADFRMHATSSDKADSVEAAVAHIIEESKGKRGATLRDIAYLMAIDSAAAKRRVEFALSQGKVENRGSGSTYSLFPKTSAKTAQEGERPCGCPEDYHLADCPILTDRGGYDDAPDPDDFYSRWASLHQATSQAMTCDKGHQWESSAGETCPVCGEKGYLDAGENNERYSSLHEADLAEILDAEAALEQADGDVEKAAAFFRHDQAPSHQTQDPMGERHQREREDEREMARKKRDYYQAHPDETHETIQGPSHGDPATRPKPRMNPTVFGGLHQASEEGEVGDYTVVCPGCGRSIRPDGGPCPLCGWPDKINANDHESRNPTVVDYLMHGLFPGGAMASATAVNENAKGTERYQAQPSTKEGPKDAWDGDQSAAGLNPLICPTCKGSGLDNPKGAERKPCPKCSGTGRNPARWKAEASKQAATFDGNGSPENLFGDKDSNEFATNQQRTPHTTRPRMMPPASPNTEVPGGNHMKQVDDGTGTPAFEQHDLHTYRDQGFSMPSFDQQVAAKVQRIASRVKGDNPHLSDQAATEIAKAALSRFPSMVGAQR